MRKTAAVLLAVLWLIAACTGCSTLGAPGAQGVGEEYPHRKKVVVGFP